MPRYTATQRVFLNGYLLGEPLNRSLIIKAGQSLDYDLTNKEIRFQGVICQANIDSLIGTELTLSGSSPLFDSAAAGNAEDIIYDNDNSNLSANNLQEAIDELSSITDGLDSTTTLNSDNISNLTNDLNDLENTVNNIDTSAAKFYVSDALGDDSTGNGSITKPFKTVQKALDSLTGGLAAVIILSNGDYAGNVTISRDNVMIQGYGPTDAHSTRILGKITVNSPVTRFKMKDLKVSVVSSLSDVAITFQDTQGRHYFDNVTFENQNGTSGDVAVWAGVNNRWVEFNNCTFSGGVQIAGTPAANSSVRFRNVDSTDTRITVAHDNWTVMVYNAPRLGKLTHSAGKFVANGIYLITSTDANAIVSTATSPNGFLSLTNVNFQQSNLSYKGIMKTGNCGWQLNLCNYDPTLNIFTGSRVSYLSRTVDILAGFTPTNYNPGDIDVIAHLIAIDNKFGQMQIVSSGPVANKPGGVPVGFVYFATDLNTNGSPIWYNGSNYVDASGNIVP